MNDVGLISIRPFASPCQDGQELERLLEAAARTPAQENNRLRCNVCGGIGAKGEGGERSRRAERQRYRI